MASARVLSMGGKPPSVKAIVRSELPPLSLDQRELRVGRIRRVGRTKIEERAGR